MSWIIWLSLSIAYLIVAIKYKEKIKNLDLTKFQKKSVFYFSITFFLATVIFYIDNKYDINIFLFSAINIALLYMGFKVGKETMIVGKALKNKYNNIKD